MFLVLLVFVVVTIETEKFPVAAIRWVVVMIHILMVNRQFSQVLGAKVATTSAADPGIELEGLIAIAGGALIARLAGTGHDPIKLVEIDVLARKGMSGVTGIGHEVLRALPRG